jgi:hypothetical protein
MVLKRRQLPRIAQFDVDINLEKLQNECDKFASKFVDVQSANKDLCMNHSKIAEIYKYFEEVPLTTSTKQFELTKNVRERILRREEMFWNQPTKDFENSYFKKITDQFIAPVTRVRLTKLPPKKDLLFHVDYDPSYAVRVVVPIYTNKHVKNLFRWNGKEENYFLEHGKAYFLNTGIEHAVVNESNEPRIALIFSLDGQADIQKFKNV